MIDGEGGRTACKEYEARLEDLLEGGTDPAVPELAAHLERCGGCRQALEAAHFGRELLREVLEPAGEPGAAFAARVVANIRFEEARRLSAGAFWRPLERLASRLALSAAAALLVLAVYLFEYAPPRQHDQIGAQGGVTEVFSDPAAQPPANQDDVLMSLAERGHGR